MARSIPLIFEEVAAANSFGARKKVLLENESNPLKDLLKYAFHPDIKFVHFTHRMNKPHEWEDYEKFRVY